MTVISMLSYYRVIPTVGVGLTLAIANPYTVLAIALLTGAGWTAKSLANRCCRHENTLPHLPEPPPSEQGISLHHKQEFSMVKNRQKVLLTHSYRAILLDPARAGMKDQAKQWLAAGSMKDLPGLVQKIGPPDCIKVCYDWASEKSGIRNLSLSDPVEKLKGQGCQLVELPQKGDLIFYTLSNSPIPWSMYHVGVVSEVTEFEIWVDSKWGNRDVCHHLQEFVPPGYGDAVIYLRPPSKDV